jgi:hypothetical protein
MIQEISEKELIHLVDQEGYTDLLKAVHARLLKELNYKLPKKIKKNIIISAVRLLDENTYLYFEASIEKIIEGNIYYRITRIFITDEVNYILDTQCELRADSI